MAPSLFPKLQQRLRTKSTPGDGHERGSSDDNPLPSTLRAALDRDPPSRPSMSDDARPRTVAATPGSSMLPPIAAHSPITPVWQSPVLTSSPRLAQAASHALQQQTTGPATPEITPPTPASTSSPRLGRSATTGGRKSPSHAHSRAIPIAAMSPDLAAEHGRAMRRAASVEELAAPRQGAGVPAGVGLGLGYPFAGAKDEPETIAIARTRSSPGQAKRSESAASASRQYASATSSPAKGKGPAVESSWPSAPINLPGDGRPRAQSSSRSRSGSIPAHERATSEMSSGNGSSLDDHVPPLPSSPSFNRLIRSNTRHSLASSTEEADESQPTVNMWPRHETFAVDLARARRFRPTSTTTRPVLVRADSIDIDDAASGASSDGEYGTDLAEGDSDVDESATANISHAVADASPRSRSKRPPLSRSGSTDENGMLIPPEMASMRARMAKRQQDVVGRSSSAAHVPPDLVLAAALARERSDSGPTQPRTAPLLARDASVSGVSTTNVESDDAAMRTRSFSDSAIAEQASGVKSTLPRSVLSRELSQMSEASLSTLAGLAGRSDDASPKSSRARSGSTSLLKEVRCVC